MRFGKKSGLIAGAVLLASVLMTGCGGNQASVGYFNAERIDKESEALKAIEAEANEKLAEAQKEAIALQGKRAEMSDEDFMKAQQAQMLKMQALNQKYQIEIQQKVQQALETISKEKKLDAVMANSNMQKAVILGGVDITDDLLQKLK